MGRVLSVVLSDRNGSVVYVGEGCKVKWVCRLCREVESKTAVRY